MTETVDEEIAVPTVAELTEQFSAGTLLQSLFGHYARSWGREDKIGRSIADAHNAGAINILLILTRENLAEIGQLGFFGGQQLYCKMIPMLDATVQEIADSRLRHPEGLRRFGLLQPSRSDRLLNLDQQVGADE